MPELWHDAVIIGRAATGLYYLAELVEEYTSLTRRIIGYIIKVIVKDDGVLSQGPLELVPAASSPELPCRAD